MTLLFIYLTIAIGVSFLCSILEAVLLSVSPSYIEQVSERNLKGGSQLAKVKERIDESLSSILILNTFAHTMGAAGVGSQAIQIFGAEWETLIAILLTLSILYFSEIIPKTLGATYWQTFAIPAAYTISWLIKIVYPLVWLSTRITLLFSKNTDREITREEIIALASVSYKDGSLLTHENEYLVNLLRMRDVKVEQILTPRSVVHMLHDTIKVTDALNLAQTQKFSRMPLYGKNIDEITGCILRNELFIAEREGKGDILVSELAQPIYRVSEKLPVNKMLDFFIKGKIHLALVEDEFGQTVGVVTLEDAIETLLGKEIVDESDMATDMQDLAKRKYRERLRKDKNI
ncbi:CNNM domain-containing protein [Catenovulum sp. 2E275]|uniref:CNNM domain-containing protein n=1 Tax=Catenovulum sp. 2E275 TaxID=2980497 RepID=UPI0021CE5121|nr:CNNM domain-containing protein [Catenovulum sp. 2E275]MCU4676813.1 CNNM domain-containing protein [Catenovulum sp. 2E275]